MGICSTWSTPKIVTCHQSRKTRCDLWREKPVVSNCYELILWDFQSRPILSPWRCVRRWCWSCRGRRWYYRSWWRWMSMSLPLFLSPLSWDCTWFSIRNSTSWPGRRWWHRRSRKLQLCCPLCSMPNFLFCRSGPRMSCLAGSSQCRIWRCGAGYQKWLQSIGRRWKI